MQERGAIASFLDTLTTPDRIDMTVLPGRREVFISELQEENGIGDNKRVWIRQLYTTLAGFKQFINELPIKDPKLGYVMYLETKEHPLGGDLHCWLVQQAKAKDFSLVAQVTGKALSYRQGIKNLKAWRKHRVDEGKLRIHTQ